MTSRTVIGPGRWQVEELLLVAHQREWMGIEPMRTAILGSKTGVLALTLSATLSFRVAQSVAA